MKFIGIIPARYASTRFPGKPLADMAGRPMIQRVYEQVKDVLDAVCVATDDSRIEAAVKSIRRKCRYDFRPAPEWHRPCLRSLH